MFIVKFQGGASGVKRDTFDAAIGAAMAWASKRHPAVVYVVGAPNRKLATVHVDGGIDFTPDAAAFRS